MRSNIKDFGNVPSVRYNRSRFLMPHNVKTSMSVGELVPVACTEVLPGDTFSTELNAVIRVSSSFIKPIVDDLYADIYHFFVPYRLVYDDAEKVFGNPSPSAYIDNNLASFPTTQDNYTVYEKTVADYLGLPLGFIPKGVNIMPFRAFAKIYNDWFRNENVIDEVYIQKGEFNGESFNNEDWSPNNYTGKCPKVSKKKDYFTSCLPRTQKGQAVALPLGTRAELNTDSASTGINAFKSAHPLAFEMANASTAGSSFNMAFTYGASTGIGKVVLPNKDNASYSGTPSLTNTILGTNLYADLTDVTSATVNDLRFAFQLQKSLEKDALYGSTYREYLLGHFGVSSPDSRLQYSEYLGGGRFPITVQQVTQSTTTDDKEKTLGNVGAWSLSNGKSHFSKAFVEHGYIFTVACIRQIHTYQQGVPKMFMRSVREDYYDPLYANLGEQPVWESELFSADPAKGLKDTVFGYNEAWADYRYIPNRVSAQMRHNAEASFDVWHLADYYSNAPTLSKEFVEENSANIDRVLNVATSVADNFLCDFFFKTNAIRVLPAYSIPGLIDHH